MVGDTIYTPFPGRSVGVCEYRELVFTSSAQGSRAIRLHWVYSFGYVAFDDRLFVECMTDRTRVFNADCLPAMIETPDKFYDLAIVDPPYGINAGERRGDTGKNKHIKQNDYKYSDWDSKRPDLEYFHELIRCSKNQIIWGGNYFDLGPSKCYIVWNKKNGDNLYADCELAWASFDSTVRMFEYRWFGFLQERSGDEKEVRIHPTQKPVQLYKWLLHNYAKPGDKILDTHLGSQSSRIAAFDMGFDFTGYELDKDYFDAGNKRFAQHKAQLKLFPV